MLQATARTTIQFFISIVLTKTLLAQPTNDNFACSGLPVLTPSSSCSSTSGDLYQSTNSGISSTCGTTYDVWYRFTTPSGCTSVSIDVTPIAAGGNNLTASNTFIQAFSAASCSLTPSGSCTAMGTTLTLTGLTPATTYYVRVFVTSNPSSQSGKWDFDICITYIPPPTNDDCSAATLLTSSTTCSNTAGTLVNSTASSGLPAGCESAGTHYDVWYKFVATNASHTITISSQGSNFTNPEIQLYSGSGCGSLTSVACGTTALTSTTLISSNTYYLRVSNIGSGPTSNAGFNICITNPAPPVIVTAGRMNEVYKQTILSGANVLADPWEVTFGADSHLWITESKGYKAYRIDTSTGVKTTVLDISQGASGYLTAAEHTAFNVQFTTSQSPWPQGGFAGLALHPKFLDPVSPKNYVYISYVRKYDSTSVTTNGGVFFTNSLVRFTYNTVTGKLESPVALCDTLPGSSDHNSQRVIIAPVSGTYYLFYGEGDMGSGQFGNQFRANKAQNSASYEGKILRFNLEDDGDVSSALDKWIPNDNPYNGAKQSAVWSIGIRNNQGFARDTSLNILYGSSHGPYSDDEINIIQGAKNYGHPLVIGFAADGNYNNTTAGTAPNMSGGGSGSSCPTISNEVTAAAAIGANYKDPLFSAYPNSPTFPSITNLWNTTTGGNASWPSEAWSGLDLYSHTLIPGWKRSLVAASLKWGRLIRLKLGATGTTTLPNNTVNDTISYFGSTNRFRDLAFAPNGKDIYVIMDRSSTTSGPSALNPIVPACAGCVIKYTFLGYNDVSGKSSIPTSIDVTSATLNTVDSATTITIDGTNNNLWVPITGPDGNIMAEIYPNGNNLGTVRSAFYQHAGAIRVKSGVRYLDRNITITPQYQPTSAVKIRLYFSKAEYDALDADPLSGVTSISNLKILKNNDPCGPVIASNTMLINPTFAEAHGSNGYMLQGDITSFSSFYFATSIILPLHLLTFNGSLQNSATLLEWETTNETNTSHFIVERSLNGQNFGQIGTVAAAGNSSIDQKYSFIDYDATHQSSSILYYRLKMVDIDGSFTYSGVVTISLPFITGKVTVFPNPASDEVRVTITTPAAGKVKWNLIDNTGRVIVQNSAEFGKGNNNLSLNIRNLPTGIYYLSVSGAGIDQKVKLEKL